LHWEDTDEYEKEHIEQVIKYEEEEEELEVRLSNIYNGDDVAEVRSGKERSDEKAAKITRARSLVQKSHPLRSSHAIANAVINNVVDPIGKYLCCEYCFGGCCGLCGCFDRTLCCCCGEEEDDEDFSRAGSISTSGSTDDGHAAMKAIV
jgi:hypothetical protein